MDKEVKQGWTQQDINIVDKEVKQYGPQQEINIRDKEVKEINFLDEAVHQYEP